MAVIPNSKRPKAPTGLSLMEVLVGLVLFGVVAVPLMTLPLKGAKQAESIKHESNLTFEVKYLLGDFQDQLGYAYRFLPMELSPQQTWQENGLDEVYPLTQEAAVPENVRLQNKMMFVGYWDPNTQSTRRIGFMFRRIQLESGEFAWQLFKADLGDAALTMNAAIQGRASWQLASRSATGQEYYLTGPKATGTSTVTNPNSGPASQFEPNFVYCQSNLCNLNISPGAADGVKIQFNPVRESNLVEDPVGADIVAHFEETSYTIRPLYFKLGGKQNNLGRTHMPEQVLPFTSSVKRWAKSESCLQEVSSRSRNCQLSNEGVGTNLTLADMLYDFETDKLYTVSASATPNNRFYIHRFSPGERDYQAYEDPNTIASIGNSRDSFPVNFTSQDPGWVAGSTMRPLSITLDSVKNMILLVKASVGATDSYYIYTFSPFGKYLSRFNITGTVNQEARGIPFGVTFNPTAPREVLVGFNTATNRVSLFGFLKDTKEDDPDKVLPSAVFRTGTRTGFGIAGARNLEYDALSSRLLISNATTIHSVDLSAPQPERTLVTLNTIWLNSNNDIYPETFTAPNLEAVAYNTLTNSLYITSGGFYYQVIPNELLNETRINKVF
jgi:hypothetical protein